jgi:hypothetical protein
MESAALFWNAVALDANKEDHTGTPAEAGGPVYSARALAMVHAAMADAHAAAHLGGGGAPPFAPAYTSVAPSGAALPAAALAGAAHTVLSAIFTRQQSFFDAQLAAFQGIIAGEDPGAVETGLRFGRTVAEAILGQRAHDGSDDPTNGSSASPYRPGGLAGLHDADPLNPGQGFYAWHYGRTRPFVLLPHEMLEALPPQPPQPHEPHYLDNFVEAVGNGRREGSTRTDAETETGIFWAYDGTRGLGTPPRLYNQVIRKVGEADGLDEDQWVALLAQANLALADAGAVAWHAKYLYNVWRPVVGIRRHIGLPDRPDADRDPAWMPLGAPASNGSNGGRDFTPPFPAYPSGHATFGAACFTVLREFRARHTAGDPDAISIDVVSDELNGTTTDAAGAVRPEVTRHFASIEEMIMQNLESRIFLGVHWRFDGEGGRQAGVAVGQRVADRVYTLPPTA